MGDIHKCCENRGKYTIWVIELGKWTPLLPPPPPRPESPSPAPIHPPGKDCGVVDARSVQRSADSIYLTVSRQVAQ